MWRRTAGDDSRAGAGNSNGDADANAYANRPGKIAAELRHCVRAPSLLSQQLTKSVYLSRPRSHHQARYSPRQINLVGLNPLRGGRYGDCKREHGRRDMVRRVSALGVGADAVGLPITACVTTPVQRLSSRAMGGFSRNGMQFPVVPGHLVRRAPLPPPIVHVDPHARAHGGPRQTGVMVCACPCGSGKWRRPTKPSTTRNRPRRQQGHNRMS